MAQFYYDWSGYSDWTDVQTEFTGGGTDYNSADYQHVSDSSYTGGAYVEKTGPATNSYVYEDTDIGVVADQEVYLSLPDEGPNNRNPVSLRLDTTNNVSYALYTTAGAKSDAWTDVIIEYTSAGSTDTQLATATHPDNGGSTTGWDYRFRANGTDLKAKLWQTGTTEPSSWTLTTSDSSITSGYTAVFGYSFPITTCDVFGVGTDGDSAPKTAISSPSPPSAPTNLSLTTQ